MTIKRWLIALLSIFSLAMPAKAISLALDSIAEWGAFPRFCVNTYHWGDRFFNGYDTAYVVGTGYKFNIKTKADSWVDYYNFDLPDNNRMRMLSRPSTSTGLWLTYLAVSVGYDKNVSKLFGGAEDAREQFQFGFNCSLFSCKLYYINNHGGTRISKFGQHGATYNPHIDFDGAHSESFGVDVYYFFNHKKYSQAAAFNFSRVQTRSQGSFFAGFSYSHQNYNFDFSSLPAYMKDKLPSSWPDYMYSATTRNNAIKIGYGYNWVFAPKWVLGVSESPTIGIRNGQINSQGIKKNTFALSNEFRISLIWNNNRWFAGIIGEVLAGLIYDKDSTFENATGSVNLSVGYRFNLW